MYHSLLEHNVTPHISKLWILIVGVVLFLAGCATRTVINPKNTLDYEKVQIEIKPILQHGDWLVTRGIHDTDNLVATFTNSPFSHAAIYDAEHNQVIEAEGKGVHTTALPDFIAKSQRILIIRPLFTSPKNAKHAVNRALSWVDKGYNFTGLIGLNMPDRYYCTQLIIAAYKPFIKTPPNNPFPLVIEPGQVHHWGRIIYDSGP